MTPKASYLLGHTLMPRLDVAMVITLSEVRYFIPRFSGINFSHSPSVVSVSLSPP